MSDGAVYLLIEGLVYIGVPVLAMVIAKQNESAEKERKERSKADLGAKLLDLVRINNCYGRRERLKKLAVWKSI